MSYETSEYKQGYDDGFSDAEQDYDSGFHDGCAEGFGEFPDALKKLIQERLNYLLLGGSWDVPVESTHGAYIEGFMDAMKTLGLKP